uniref:Uncharacterized protein n=1 Tax=Fundulus heteroclitus TaxID=8078 RepID=A0A3Q2SSV9_FUNHE
QGTRCKCISYVLTLSNALLHTGHAFGAFFLPGPDGAPFAATSGESAGGSASACRSGSPVCRGSASARICSTVLQCSSRMPSWPWMIWCFFSVSLYLKPFSHVRQTYGRSSECERRCLAMSALQGRIRPQMGQTFPSTDTSGRASGFTSGISLSEQFLLSDASEVHGSAGSSSLGLLLISPFSWTRMACRFMSYWSLNRFSQLPHLYFRSRFSLWISWCRLMAAARRNVLLHTGHVLLLG